MFLELRLGSTSSGDAQVPLSSGGPPSWLRSGGHGALARSARVMRDLSYQGGRSLDEFAQFSRSILDETL